MCQLYSRLQGFWPISRVEEEEGYVLLMGVESSLHDKKPSSRPHMVGIVT